MLAYDDIVSTKNKKLSYNKYDVDETIQAFRQACRKNDPLNAIYYGLDLYLNSEKQRQLIISEIFIVILEDKSLANTALFPQVYQLLVKLIKRKEEEEKEELKEEKKEEWKLISNEFGVKDYSVSTKGRIRYNDSKNRNNFSKQVQSGSYYYVNLNDKKINVDKIVAKTFLDNKNEYEFIQHIDGNLLNNEVSNLKWVKKENQIEGKPKKEKLKSYLTIKEDDITEDENRKTYIFRFILAIYLISQSYSTQVINIANDLFKIDDDDDLMENKSDFVEKYDSPEINRDLFQIALYDKNLADCLYYSNILYFHPNEREDKIKWGNVKSAYSYIWDVFDKVTKRNSNKQIGSSFIL